MVMSTSSRSDENPEPMVDINTTPLIDVMLVLLIMLIITIPIQTHAVKLDLPTPAPSTVTTPPQIVQVEINIEGVVSWNGKQIESAASLDRNLREVAAQADQPELHLHPAKGTAYRDVAAVMAAAERLGVTKLGLVSDESLQQ